MAHVKVGDRCEVSPGGRRGTVRWVGVLDEKNPARGGYWVGIVLDEPTGKNDGSFNGKSLFKCAPNYGVFVRGENVKVGDYPEEDLDLDEEFFIVCLHAMLLFELYNICLEVDTTIVFTSRLIHS